MGYRSEIVIVVNKIRVAEAKLQKTLPKVLAEDWGTRTSGKTALYWRFDQIKWYGSYPEVQECMTWLNSLADIEIDISHPKPGKTMQTSWGFLRIGEEESDIESLGDPYYFNVIPERTITVYQI